MKKYNNCGIDMGGLSMTDNSLYMKIHAVLNEKGRKKDLLDIVETVPLEYAYDLADKGPTPEDDAALTELKKAVAEVLTTLTPREERTLRMRFGIGLKNDYTLDEVGVEFSVTKERVRQMEAKALRKLEHPSTTEKLCSFLAV